MSEYQYYEFQTVDRPLTAKEMSELRAISTRAEITPTRFQNFYTYGDFKGDPQELMGRYFDAFVYTANWGTNWFMLRLPQRMLDVEIARRYAVDGTLTVHEHQDHLILEFLSEDEEGGYWIADEEAEGWMPTLLPLRSELESGDLRCLYLAWLAGAEFGPLDDDDLEPPVPAGLGDLSPSLVAFARFLRVSEDVIAVAAELSPAVQTGPTPADLQRWVRSLSIEEKDDILIRLIQSDGRQLHAETSRRFREATKRTTVSPGQRTVAELLAKAEARAEIRREQERDRLEAERLSQERQAAAAHEKHLDRLAGREPEFWQQVEALIETKQPAKYDRAVKLVSDLRDLAVREGAVESFGARLEVLRARCARRPSLLQRLNAAGLSNIGDGPMFTGNSSSER